MQNVKGTYDFLGKEQAMRRRVQSVLTEVFELYDFEGMESTILNELELLTSKYAGGDEIVKEMYQLTDQGRRKLGLRYDLTIPFAKVVALNPGLPIPYRRYEIGKVFRDGPVKRGRLREFLQCDVDMVGAPGPEAEIELLQIAAEVFRRLDIPITIRWNNRSFLGEFLEALGVPPEEKLSVMLTLDKIAKIGSDGVVQELAAKALDTSVIEAITNWIEKEVPPFEKMASDFGIADAQGACEVRALQALIDKVGLGDVCAFDPFLSRGLSFYTGTVYEIVDATKWFASSLGGGGRYDTIIGKLIGREDIQYPTVGLSFGMESIMELLRARPFPETKPAAVLIPIGEEAVPDGLKLAAELRSAGIRTGLESGNRKLKKALAAAATRGVRFVILVGDEEAKAGKIRLKNMQTGAEELITVQEAIDRIARQQGEV